MGLTAEARDVVRRTNTERMESDVLNDVIPLVERAYRVQKDRSQRAITGLSMGGGQSLTIGLQHTDLYLADFMPRLFRNGKAAGS